MSDRAATSAGRPGARVLAAFGLAPPVRPMAGGAGTSVLVDGVVLKPGADPEEAEWLAELTSRVLPPPGAGFRLAEPVRATGGAWQVDGWTAHRWVEGRPPRDADPRTWSTVLTAGRALHARLAAEPQPEHLCRLAHRWAVADRATWGEAAIAAGPFAPELALLAMLVVDERLPRQLVHGDLAGNVLLAESGRVPPAVIDLSLSWRPPAYADALVVVDAAMWWHTSDALVDLARPVGLDPARWTSLLARALRFRLLADAAATDQAYLDLLRARAGAVLSSWGQRGAGR